MAGELTKREEALTLSQVQAQREETARPASTGQNQSQRRRLAEAMAETAREATDPGAAADAVETFLRCFSVAPDSFKWGDIIAQAMWAEGLNKFQAVKDMAIREVVAAQDRQSPMLDDGELAARAQEWFMDSPPPLEDVMRAVARVRGSGAGRA